ncbi:MAG: MFS transporter [Gaiellaceae bacterium]|jgi:EmrB/QacA subfamily drug resistance transporter
MGSDSRKWKTLAVVGTAFFMTILDVSIVNVALPTIGTHLKVSNQSLEWVVIGYAIAFGGFLLLGGRAADLIGRRRVFVGGVALFTTASLVSGFAGSLNVLIAARLVQGLGAAAAAPSALSIVTTEFKEGPERNKALGIWGAIGGSGSAIGVLAGGVLTSQLGWRWIFWVNVPIGAVVLVSTFLIVRESRNETEARHFDLLGALTAAASLVLVTYAISKAPTVGWMTLRTIGLLVLSATFTLTFLLVEFRAPRPLMPLSILKVRTVAGANAAGLLLGAVVFSNFFLLTLYVQQVLGWSSLKTGLTFLASAGSVVLWAGVSQALVTKLGPRIVLSTGFVLLGGALLFYTRLPVHGSYTANLLPGYLIFACGLAFAFVPVSIAALAGVPKHQAGLASGLLNTNQQVGGVIGLAVAATVLNSHTAALIKQGTAHPLAATESFRLAFWVLVGIAFAAAVISALVVRELGGPKPKLERVSVNQARGRRELGMGARGA